MRLTLLGLALLSASGCGQTDAPDPQPAPVSQHVPAADALAFPVQADAFEGTALVSLSGELLLPPGGRLERLSATRWIWTGPQGRPLRWLDAQGRLLGTVEQAGRWTPLPAADPSTAPQRWVVHRGEASALVDEDGTLRSPWWSGGDWSATRHPQRFRWRHRHQGEERFVDEQGALRYRVAAGDGLRLSGPFAEALVYLICEGPRGQDCALQQESGGSLFRLPGQRVEPLQEGGWLLQQAGLWWPLAADGSLRAGEAYRQEAGSALGSGAVALPWPVRAVAQGASLQASARHGLLSRSGRFIPLDGPVMATGCPDLWAVMGGSGQVRRLVDEGGRPVLELGRGRVWPLSDAWLQVRRETVEGEVRSVLVDCQGREWLVQGADMVFLPMGPGVALRRDGQALPHAWWAPSLQQPVPESARAVHDVSADGRLLLVEDEDGVGLHDVSTGRRLGPSVPEGRQLTVAGLVFAEASSGLQGFLTAQGHQVLPPRYVEILPWGQDRLWSRDLEEMLRLHDAKDGRVLWQQSRGYLLRDRTQWTDAAAERVAPVVGATYQVGGRSILAQWWVDRDGQVRARALRCRDLRRPAAGREGVLWASDRERPLHQAGACTEDPSDQGEAGQTSE